MINTLKEQPGIYKGIVKYFSRDFLYSPSIGKRSKHILFVRDIYEWSHYNWHFLAWIKEYYPKALEYVRLVRMTKIPFSLKSAQLVVLWLNDSLELLYPQIHQKAISLQQCIDIQKIPTINRVGSLINGSKYRASQIIRDSGIRTPMTIKINDPKDFDPEDHQLPYPFFIREDLYHRGPIQLVYTKEDLQQVNWNQFKNPIAVEYVETKDRDGFYRKCRCISFSDMGCPRHMIIAKDWCVHAKDRTMDPKHIKEEREYISLKQDPNCERFNRAREALGFDTVAFDYSYDKSGEVIIWEPNVLPGLWSQDNAAKEYEYLMPSVDQLYRKLIAYYFERANMVEEWNSIKRSGKSYG